MIKDWLGHAPHMIQTWFFFKYGVRHSLNRDDNDFMIIWTRFEHDSKTVWACVWHDPNIVWIRFTHNLDMLVSMIKVLLERGDDTTWTWLHHDTNMI